MKTTHFIYLQKIVNKPLDSLDDLLQDSRLLRNLWLELIHNPVLVAECEKKIDNSVIRNELTKALSWYLAFKWLFNRNPSIEELAQKGLIKAYPVRGEIFKKDYRGFLKGIIPLLH